MATLIIKNLPDLLYRKLRARAKLHHRSVAQEVMQILEDSVATSDVRSILELRGLGKEIWADVDARRYLDEEHGSWD